MHSVLHLYYKMLRTMLNVRLDKELEEKLRSYSQQNNLSKSSIVKEALALYFKKEESVKTPFELGEDLFGTGSGGDAERSSTYKSRVKEKLREKHSH